MNFRPANMNDLPQIKAVYRGIIDHMNQHDVPIWDDVYPCDFFAEDIINNRLYLLEDSGTIASAFALSAEHAGAAAVNWANHQSKAIYIDRLGVNVDYLKKGIGSMALQKAIALAHEMGGQYLRLFVVDFNTPAINLYLKNGFQKVDGSYDEVIDDDLTLYEYGFEIKTSM